VRQSSGELFTSSADATLGDCEFERRGKSPAGRGRQVAAEGHWATSNRRLSARIQDPPGYKIRIRSDLNRGRVPSAEDEPAPQSRRYIRSFANLLPQRSIEVLGYPASAIPKTNIGRVVNRC
jgi:hypothetical protein